MAKITNTGVQPLVLNPGAVSLLPGVETEVEGWAALKKHPITKFYLDEGILSLDGPDESEEDPEAGRKDDLLAQLKALGAKPAKGATVDKLESQLVEAQQRASVVEALNSLNVEFDAKDSTEDLQALLAKNNEPSE